MVSVQEAALARLATESDNKNETAFLTDPSSPWLLAHVANRCLDIRALDWSTHRDQEPAGFRLKSKSGSPGAKDAINVCSWSEQVIGPRVLLLHSANLTPDLVPDALEAMDAMGHAAGRTEGWAFGPAPDSEFTKAIRAMPERAVRTGRRAEIDGQLLTVAWYGDQKERGRFLDLDMLGWC